jgi:hypothetical protein
MLKSLVLMFLMALAFDCLGQLPDTMRLKVRASEVDSASALATQRLDQYNSQKDSLLATVSVIRLKDSLKVEEWSQELKRKVSSTLSNPAISKTLDSLRSTGMPAIRLGKVSDSLRARQASLLGEVESIRKNLQRKLTDRYTAWQASTRTKLKLDSFGLPKAPGVAATEVNPPGINTPGINIQNPAFPSIQIDALEVPGLDLPSLNSQDFNSLELSPELKSVGGDMSVPSAETLKKMELNLPSLPGPMREVSARTAEFKALKQDPASAVEKAVGEISEVSAATGELHKAEQLTKNNEALQAADQIKEPDAVKQTLNREAVSHFAGKDANPRAAPQADHADESISK